MKSNIVKLFFLVLASLPISISAELSDTLKVPWRNPCSHSDPSCLDFYANPGRDPLWESEKRVTTEIVNGLSAEEIGEIPALSISLALCKEYIFEEKFWKLDKEKNDKGLINVELELPEEYIGLSLDDSSIVYGEPLAPLLFVDLEPYVDDGKLYYFLKFTETDVPILFEATYSGMLDETSKQCYSGSLTIKL